MKPISIWPYRDAPQEYKSLSPHGGDEDFVALIPSSWNGMVPAFLDEGSEFDCCDVSEKKLENGDLILIGAHA